jgi:hypothetical protein
MTHETTDHGAVRQDSSALLRALSGISSAGLVFGFIGIVGAIAGFLLDTRAAFASYTFAFAFWMSLTIGFLTLTFLHHAVRATWTLSMLRIIEAGNRTYRVMFLAWLPLAIGVATHRVYEWSDPANVAASAMLQHKHIYLNPTAWIIRGFVYFAFWLYTMTQMNRSSLLQDETRDERLALQRSSFGAAFGCIHVLLMTLAVTDWFMSLDPIYYSTIYAVIFMMAGVLAATALGAYLLTRYSALYPFSTIMTPALTRNIGNMLLGFTMFWAYTSLAQFLIQWSANLPEEISFYAQRFVPPLVFVGAIVVICQFVLPFLALLPGRSKRTFSILQKISAVIVVMRLVDCWWQITPFFRHGFTAADLPGLALDFGCWAAIGGLWIFSFIGSLKRYPLLATHDMRLIEAKGHSHA